MLRNKKGWTLVELLVVMGILSTLVFVASTSFKPVADTSKETVLITNCGKVKDMIESEIAGAGITDMAETDTWLTANIDNLILRANIVNVYSEPRAYQVANAVEPELGAVTVAVSSLYPDYFMIKGCSDVGPPTVYVPVPELRVRW